MRNGIKTLFGGMNLTWPKLIVSAVIAGALTGIAAVAALTLLCLRNPYVYRTEIMGNGVQYRFDDTYAVSLADDRYGSVEIRYELTER